MGDAFRYGKLSFAATSDLDVRERILRDGASTLSDAELLAALLGTGTAGKSVGKLAEEVLDLVDNGKPGPRADILQKVSGMGSAKACAVTAALELGRRLFLTGDSRIASPRDVFPLISHFADRKQERFLCVSLNGAHEAIAVRVVSVGLVNRTVVHPREVFADPITDRACAVVVAHNHPSGNLEPSREDLDITRRLRNAGEVLGMPVLDHIVFSRESFYSFVEHGVIPPVPPD